MEITIILIYLVGTTAISYFAYRAQEKKRALDAGSFMVEHKKMGVFVIVCTQLGVAYGGGSTVGIVADVHEIGVSGAWLTYTQIFVHLIFALFSVKMLTAMNRKYGIITVPGVYEKRFDNRVRIVVTIVTCIFYLLAFSLQPIAAAALLSPVLHVDYFTMAWICGLIFVLVVILGGMKGINWMNTVHTTFMVVGMCTLFFLSVNEVGGFGGLLNATNVPEGFYSFAEPSLQAVVGSFLALLFGNMFNSLSATITFGAKSMKTARTGILIAVFIMVLMAVFPLCSGILGYHFRKRHCYGMAFCRKSIRRFSILDINARNILYSHTFDPFKQRESRSWLSELSGCTRRIGGAAGVGKIDLQKSISTVNRYFT